MYTLYTQTCKQAVREKVQVVKNIIRTSILLEHNSNFLPVSVTSI